MRQENRRARANSRHRDPPARDIGLPILRHQARPVVEASGQRTKRTSIGAPNQKIQVASFFHQSSRRGNHPRCDRLLRDRPGCSSHSTGLRLHAMKTLTTCGQFSLDGRRTKPRRRYERERSSRDPKRGVAPNSSRSPTGKRNASTCPSRWASRAACREKKQTWKRYSRLCRTENPRRKGRRAAHERITEIERLRRGA